MTTDMINPKTDPLIIDLIILTVHSTNSLGNSSNVERNTFQQTCRILPKHTADRCQKSHFPGYHNECTLISYVPEERFSKRG